MGGDYKIIEVDEALLDKKPTYGHGKVNTIFKIWVLGILERGEANQIKNCILKPVRNRTTKTLGDILIENVS